MKIEWSIYICFVEKWMELNGANFSLCAYACTVVLFKIVSFTPSLNLSEYMLLDQKLIHLGKIDWFHWFGKANFLTRNRWRGVVTFGAKDIRSSISYGVEREQEQEEEEKKWTKRFEHHQHRKQQQHQDQHLCFNNSSNDNTKIKFKKTSNSLHST